MESYAPMVHNPASFKTRACWPESLGASAWSQLGPMVRICGRLAQACSGSLASPVSRGLPSVLGSRSYSMGPVLSVSRFVASDVGSASGSCSRCQEEVGPRKSGVKFERVSFRPRPPAPGPKREQLKLHDGLRMVRDPWINTRHNFAHTQRHEQSTGDCAGRLVSLV